MRDELKTKKQFMKELHELRGRVSELEGVEVRRGQAEEALRESKNRYRFLIDNSKEIVLILNKRGKIIFANKSTLTNYGYSREELIGKPITRFLTRDCVRRVLSALKEEFAGHPRPDMEVRAKTTSGEIRYLRVVGGSVPVYEKGRLIGVMVNASDITDHYKAKEVLRESEKQFKELWDNAPVAYHTLDTKGFLINMNQTEAKMLGYAREEMVGKSIFEFILPEQQAKAKKRFRLKMLNQSVPKADDRIYVKKDGARICVDIEDVVERDSDGKIIGIRTTMVDITERKMAEDSLRESEGKFRNLAEQSPNMIFIEINGRIVYANEKCEETMGYRKDEIYSPEFDFLRMIAPEFREKIIINLRKHMKGEGILPYECALLTRKGKRIESIIATRLIDYGGEKAILGTVTDITERKRAEEALFESEERYRNLFANVPVGLYRTTPAGEWLDGNAASARMLGYPDRESMIKANPLADYVNPEERERWKAILEKNGVLEDFESHLRRQDGRIIWVKDSARAIKDREGRVLYYEGAMVDFTERKKAEEGLNYTLEMLHKSLGATIQAINRLVEMRDPYTAGHQRRVADLARAIATEMGLSQDQVDGIRMAGSIHDIGKISVPAEILSKPGRLEEREFNLIKVHPKYAYEILKPVEFPGPVAQAILQHHERIDGSGYPLGLKDKEIIVEAKILAVADVVEAMVSHRPYRAAHSLEHALKEISKNSGVLYDPKAVEACLNLFVEKGFTFREEGNPTISPN